MKWIKTILLLLVVTTVGSFLAVQVNNSFFSLFIGWAGCMIAMAYCIRKLDLFN